MICRLISFTWILYSVDNRQAVRLFLRVDEFISQGDHYTLAVVWNNNNNNYNYNNYNNNNGIMVKFKLMLIIIANETLF